MMIKIQSAGCYIDVVLDKNTSIEHCADYI